jgi:hypothetical protein
MRLNERVYHPSELGVFMFLNWFGGLVMGTILGIGLGWLIF